MIRDYGNNKFKKTHVNQGQNKKKSSDKKLKYSKRGILLLMVVALVFYGLLIIVHKNEVELIYTSYGRITDEFSGKGLLIRSEKVFYAPHSGRVELLRKEGKRSSVDEPILKLTGSGKEKIFYTRESGLISYQVDGLENTLNPGILTEFKDDYQDFRGKLFQTRDGDKVNAGRPLFKIVNNFEHYLLVQVPKEEVFRYYNGEKIWTIFKEKDLVILGWIKKIIEHRNLFIIELDRFPQELIGERWADINILADADTGVYVPRQALVRKDDEFGVYRVNNDKVFFDQVSVVGGNVENAVVDGVDRGVEILANPESDLRKFIDKK